MEPRVRENKGNRVFGANRQVISFIYPEISLLKDYSQRQESNNRRLFKIIFVLLGAILAMSGARDAMTLLFK